MSQYEVSRDADELMRVAEASTGPAGWGHSANFERKLEQIVERHTRRAVKEKLRMLRHVLGESITEFIDTEIDQLEVNKR